MEGKYKQGNFIFSNKENYLFSTEKEKPLLTKSTNAIVRNWLGDIETGLKNNGTNNLE